MPDQLGRVRMPWLSGLVARFGLGNLQEWISILLLSVTLGIAIRSIEHARWTSPQPSLILVLILAIIASLLLAKSRLPKWVTYVVAIVPGLGVTVWQSAGTFAAMGAESALGAWWRSVSGVQPSEGTVYFSMFLIFVTWLIGFISTWFLLRRRNVWMAVTLGTIALLVNLSNLPRDDYYFLPIYLVAALLLIGQVNLAKQGDWLRKQGSKYPYRGIIYFVTAVLCISLLVVGAAWFTPEPPISQVKLTAGTGLQGADIQEAWFNIFANVRSKWGMIASSDQEQLFFSDPVGSGSKVNFVITAEETGYWRTRRYDTYYTWGWTGSAVTDETLEAETVWEDGDEEFAESEELTYTVESRAKTDVVITRGEFASVDIPVELMIPATIERAEEPTDSSDAKETSTEAEPIPGEKGDIVAVVSPKVLAPYQRYTITVRIPLFSLEELSQAGEEYPLPITERYLQLPDNIPQRVRMLAETLTPEAETPYDKVIVLKNFLNRYEYNLKTKPPPEDADGVDWFLFNTQEGTCVNFASSMVVMLRSLGVPARLCSGYLKGEIDEDSGDILLRNRNYHAWAEVYFPGYGWAEVETTPSSEPESEAIIVGATEDIYGAEEPIYPFGIEVPGAPADGATVIKRRTAPWGTNLHVYLLAIGGLALVILTGRLLFGRWVGRLKMIGSAFEAYAKMCYVATLGKSGPEAYETPFEYGARLVKALPAQAGEIDDITQAYVDTQYSPRKEMGQLEKARLQKTWVQLCPRLLRSVLRLRGYPEAAKPMALVVSIEEEPAVEEELAVLEPEPLTAAVEADSHHIICEDLFKIYKIADLEVVALRGLNLRVKQGELMAIVGASGSGKTTLLNILGGLDTPSAGRVVVGGRNLLQMSGGNLINYRRHDVGFVWQSVGGNLIPYLTAFQNVELPLILLGWSRKKRKKRVEEMLRAVGLSDRMNHRPDRLSGGEQQRVSIAVALAHNPPLLLADEPTGELDSLTAAGIFDVFRNLNENYGITIVTVTHDISIIEKVDRIVTIRDGRTSLEAIRRRAVTLPGEETEETVDEFVIVDSAGQLQIPKEHLEKLNLKERVRVLLAEDHVSIWPEDSQNEDK